MRLARSPTTNASGCSGTVRSGLTTTRPARSSGTPSVRPRREPATPAAQSTVLVRIRSPAHGHTVDIDGRHLPPRAHVDAQANQLFSRLLRELAGVRRKHPGRPFEQDDLRVRRIDAPKIARQRVLRDLAERPRQLDARGPRAHDDERQPGFLLRGIGLSFGKFEGREHPTPNLERVADRLEPGRERRPLFVPKVRVPRAGGHDDVVVVERAVFEREGLLARDRSTALRLAILRRSSACGGCGEWGSRCRWG